MFDVIYVMTVIPAEHQGPPTAPKSQPSPRTIDLLQSMQHLQVSTGGAVDACDDSGFEALECQTSIFKPDGKM